MVTFGNERMGADKPFPDSLSARLQEALIFQGFFVA
jgi:hypothetical protein